LRLENRFEVAAPIDRAWALLNDVPRVVPCMPGAELTETVDENTWKGVVHVRLGPVAFEFGTDVVRESRDDAGRRVVLVTKARERRGRGSAQARIESSLAEDAGKTSVEILTDLNLQGAVAQYGRGLVPEIAAQMTKQFAANIASLLEQEGEDEPPAAAPPPPAVRPVGGLGVALRAVWAQVVRLFHRR
jgi:carbon monoxide dehydrogenase subunit G